MKERESDKVGVQLELLGIEPATRKVQANARAVNEALRSARIRAAMARYMEKGVKR